MAASRQRGTNGSAIWGEGVFGRTTTAHPVLAGLEDLPAGRVVHVETLRETLERLVQSTDQERQVPAGVTADDLQPGVSDEEPVHDHAR
jgi:hypothetical protein